MSNVPLAQGTLLFTVVPTHTSLFVVVGYEKTVTCPSGTFGRTNECMPVNRKGLTVRCGLIHLTGPKVARSRGLGGRLNGGSGLEAGVGQRPSYIRPPRLVFFRLRLSHSLLAIHVVGSIRTGELFESFATAIDSIHTFTVVSNLASQTFVGF